MEMRTYISVCGVCVCVCVFVLLHLLLGLSVGGAL